MAIKKWLINLRFVLEFLARPHMARTHALSRSFLMQHRLETSGIFFEIYCS
jgi:hypothetical protein